MIPAMHITAWANVAPWAELGQIEQDLIISRAIIEIFSDEFLRNELRLRKVWSRPNSSTRLNPNMPGLRYGSK